MDTRTTINSADPTETGPADAHTQRHVRERSTERDAAAIATHTLTVRPWWDPDLAIDGFAVHDPYVERFWLGVAGPSVIWLLRRLCRGLEQHPNGFRIDVSDTARAIGLGGGTGRQAPFNRTIDRACMFGLMRRRDSELDVRTHVPAIKDRQLQRLPIAVQRTHDAFVAPSRPRRAAG